MAICGMSEEYELADIATHLEVNSEEWFEWPKQKRDKCAQKLSEISIEGVLKKKNVVLNKQ